MRIDSYCNIRFINDILGDNSKFDLTTIESIRAFKNLVLRNGNILLDDFEFFDDQECYIFKLLKKKHTQAEVRLVDMSAYSKSFMEPAFLDGLEPFTMYLGIEEETTINARGVGAVCTENWSDEIIRYTEPHTYTVDKTPHLNTFPGWSFLNPNNLPLTAAVIADNYLLKKSDRLEKNLFSIISHLLPDSLIGKTFHLTVITSREDKDRLQTRLKQVKDHVNSLNIPYSIKIQIRAVGKELHDRDILTNFFHIHSGHSLDFYNAKGNIDRSTTLYFSPINSESGEAHFKRLQQMQKIYFGGKMGFDLYGDDFVNRLLEA